MTVEDYQKSLRATCIELEEAYAALTKANLRLQERVDVNPLSDKVPDGFSFCYADLRNEDVAIPPKWTLSTDFEPSEFKRRLIKLLLGI